MSKAKSPAVSLRDALKGTASGAPQSFTTEEFLTDMKLDGDRPDGLTLINRLLGPGGLRDLRAFIQIISGV